MTVRIQNFSPEKTYVATSTGGASTPVAITQPNTYGGTSAASGGGQKLTDARIYNSSPDRAFVAFAMSGTATATADDPGSVPIGPGATNILNVGAIVSAAVILGTSTSAGKVYITMGEGS